MSLSDPIGVAFHASPPQFVVTDDTSGAMFQFNFPGNDFSQMPTVETFASGGFRGGFSQVGPDGCLYVTQQRTRYDVDQPEQNDRSLVHICGGFAPPAGPTSTPTPTATATPTHTATATPTSTPTPRPVTGAHSLAVNGSTGYAEASPTTDLNLTSEWTVETWFKDEDPNGFNHDYAQLLNKGDRAANAESPYFVLLGFKRLVAGLRTGWIDYSVEYDLRANGVDPTAWHHVASTFRAATRTLSLYLDGRLVAQATLSATSRGTTLPLEIGRNGASTGKYWRGKLDDLRIWNLVRSASEIQASYRTELSSVPAGLIANWQFNEATGSSAADHAAAHTAALHGGATFSTDVHP
jgi:hypothetical protein